MASAAVANVVLGPFQGGTNSVEAGRLPFVREGYLIDVADLRRPGFPGSRRAHAALRPPELPLHVRLAAGAASSSPDPAARLRPSTPPSGATPPLFTPRARGFDRLGIPKRLRRGQGVAGRHGHHALRWPAKTVDLTGQPVAWCLFDALHYERATLDWCSFNAFTRLKTFVCFAPGFVGGLSINASELPLEAPSKTPTIIEHEGVTLVVCNEDQVDAAYVGEDAVYIGVAGLDEEGEPIPHASFKQCAKIDAEGKNSTVRTGTPARKPNRPSLGDWQFADQSEYVTGSSDRFATIDGPATLDEMGAPHGYGWIRLEITSGNSRTVKSGVFEFADRVRMTINDKPGPILGQGPGVESAGECSIKLRKGRNVITILVDNLGRAAGGIYNGEKKGLQGHIHRVSPLPVRKCQIVPGNCIAPVKIRSPLTACTLTIAPAPTAQRGNSPIARSRRWR